MANTIDDIKDLVNDYMQQEKIAVFIGAGVSALSNYPSWSELIIKMAKKLKYPIKLKDKEGNDCLSSDEFLKIPQIYYDKFGEKKYFKFVRKELHILKEPNEIHKLIMQLKPNHILTTNYDTLIEQTANQVGISYSVINADDKVATAPTRNYILKVHGDFETNNIVLKERDYLDYENNFQLMDNLMKSIISTHLVIFIGYGLNDYNIKLILNWVKHAQNGGFIEPIFIYTGKQELSDIELLYFEGERLQVLDANKLVKELGDNPYYDKYQASLLALLNSEHTEKWYRNNTWIIDHFYKIIEPLKDVKYLRINDVAKLFPGAMIYFNEQLKGEDFKYLIQAYDGKDKLSKKRRNQLEDIIHFFLNSGIQRITDNNNAESVELNEKIRHKLTIKSDTFETSYQDITERIAHYGDDIESLYAKAYDLYWLGRLNDAKEVYYQLLAECYSHKRWVLYFFSLINLYYIRQTIFALDRNIKSVNGLFTLGKSVELWDEEELRDMRLSHGLTDIPSKIRRYSFLKQLAEKNYYKDDFVRMYQDNYEIEKRIAKEMYTFAGRPKEQEAKIRIFDAINFVYGNKIAFDKFKEHKSFTKIALQHCFEGMISQNELYARSNSENNGVKHYINFQEVLLLIRSCTYDDLSVFYEKENGNKLILDEKSLEKFEYYIAHLIEYFKSNFPDGIKSEEEKLIEYLSLKDEIKNALYIASFYVKTDLIILECVKYYLYQIPNNEIILNKRMITLGRYNNNISDSKLICDLLEADILYRIKICIEGADAEANLEKNDIAIEVDAMNSWYSGYKSKAIKNRMSDVRESLASILNPVLEKII